MMPERQDHSFLEKLRVELDRARNLESEEFQNANARIKWIAYTNSAQAELVVKQIFRRIREIRGASEQELIAKLPYYYVMDNILKNLKEKYHKYIEAIVLPSFDLELKAAAGFNDTFNKYMGLFLSWEKFISASKLVGCLNKLYEAFRSRVEVGNFRTSTKSSNLH
mgnify:CR=1 FL=1